MTGLWVINMTHHSNIPEKESRGQSRAYFIHNCFSCHCRPFWKMVKIFNFIKSFFYWHNDTFRMKKVIDGVASGPVNLVLCEILASFIFVSCIMEKGLWYANVNENYFHVATAAQDWVRNQVLKTGRHGPSTVHRTTTP